MQISNLKDFVTSKAGRAILHVQKNSPTILFAGGVVGVVGAAVLASRATLKLDDILTDIEKQKTVVSEMGNLSYTDKERKQALLLVNVRGAQEIAKAYLPAVIVGGLSIAALTRSHIILNQRNTALAAAYTAVDKAFTAYRERVTEELGEEKDQEFRWGTRDVTEKVVGDDGETVDVTTKKLDPDLPSQYARFFDESSSNWSRSSEANYVFLTAQQRYANQLLKARGHVFLNEIYISLGLPPTTAGQIVGWVYNHDEEKDGFIDFGIYSRGERSSAFVNGPEKSILLDFNVDGPIYHLLGEGEVDA